MKLNRLQKILAISARMLVGAVFMFSGFVKGADPVGLNIKLQEYFYVYYLDWLGGLGLYIGVLLCMLEFVTGAALFFNVRMRLFSWVSLILIFGFLIQTFFAAIYNPVTDCGCFGDAIKMSNWETFYKNCILFLLTFVIFRYRKFYQSIFNARGQWIVVSMAVIGSLFVSVYSYNHLPILDFLPWKKGAKISELVVPTPEEAVVYLVYKNKKTGETKEFTIDEFTKSNVWKDSTWVRAWKFQDQRKEVIKPFSQAPIHDFKLMDSEAMDHTAEVVANPQYNFILVAHLLEETSENAFGDIADLARRCEKDSIRFVCVTASAFSKIDEFRHNQQAAYPFYNVDETALKSMIRSNPGLLLLKDGVVIDKWHYHDFPTWEKVSEKYFKK